MGVEGVSCMAAVFLNDKELVPRRKKQHHAWRFDDGSTVEMSWDTFTPEIGNTVVVETGEGPFKVTSSTPARQQVTGMHRHVPPHSIWASMMMLQGALSADPCGC